MSDNDSSSTPDCADSNPNRDLLIQQYVQCRFDIRTFDSMIWQIPTASYVINGVLIAFVLEENVKGLKSIFASALLAILTAPLTVALIKNRFFQMSRVATAQDLSRKISFKLIEDYPTITSHVSIPEISSKASILIRLRAVEMTFWGKSAYYVLLSVMLTSHFVQLLLIIISFVRSI